MPGITPLRRPRYAGRLLTAALAAGALTFGATAHSAPGPAADSDRARPAAAATSPFTGLPAEPAPVLAVKVDNHRGARPHTGLDRADIVVVEQVEGGLGRLIGVYASDVPDAVGPVRSARDYNVEQLRMFDRPALAYSGAAEGVEEVIRNSPLYALSHDTFPAAYYRDAEGEAPHNLYVRPADVLAEAPDASLSDDIGFRFADDAPEDGEPTTTAGVEYPAFRADFTWSAEEERWLASFDGAPAETADGGRLGGRTVVIQEVEMRPSDVNPATPYIETVGEGSATVLRGGRAYETTWQRPDATSGTAFVRPDGERMRFDRGQVWIVYKEA
ncbi:DUF3048 domain-containing protein [Streptomyces sp. DSM 42041]|uniref:DUF3048 domain-containing protein n=1 Tax=Streptomyces hazeniae TaxID=3075538 RepID=A0ABU2NU51_9ACTN|nr:DUF3048 domain-containing protein [Streptomyces sp. DSM 42041]MDT0379502.1 DUF3048 domain-containing protein [Streptomyces sp. DSM 42041]